MKEQEKNKLKDFFDEHIHFMTVEHNPSTNEWGMKPMKGAKEELLKHFAHEEKNRSGENLQP